MNELARAKVNLSLHVVGKRADGFHLLDSIVVFPEIGDVLRLQGHGLSLSGPFAAGLAGHDNLVMRAAEMAGYAGGFHLQKNLPVASGVGGGSADAAAALRLLAKAGLPGMGALGADVPACLLSKPLRMRGIGEQLELLPRLPDFAIVLVNAGQPVPTPQVFKALKKVDNPGSQTMPEGLSQRDFFAFIKAQRNDLQAAAIKICPKIETVLTVLGAGDDCALARMSGSGGTCFGLFESLAKARRAAREIRRQNPGWWVAAAPV